jgi:hypothetical protein
LKELLMAGYSPTIADFDNNGWKDIFVTRGHVQALGSGSNAQIEQPNTVLRNLGGAKFQAMTEEAGLSAQPPARHRNRRTAAGPGLGCMSPGGSCRKRSAAPTAGSNYKPDPFIKHSQR